jgi:hypothetical protein
VDQAIWLGYGLLVGVCWILGLRGLAAAFRRNALLDWGLAGVMIGAGAIGCPLTFLPSLVPLSPLVRAQVLAAGIAGLGAGSITLYVTVWRFFRPRSVLAALVCSAGTFVISWSFVAELLTGSFSWGRDRFWLLLGGAACWVPYVWGAFEMLRYSNERLRGAQDARGVESARILWCYGLAQAAVAAVFVPALASLFLNQGQGHSRAVVAMVAFGAVLAALAAGQGFLRKTRRAARARAGGA